MPDYAAPGTGTTDYEDGSGDDEEYIYEYENEGENESKVDKGGGMSTIEKVMLASDLAMMGSKVSGWVGGRKNGSVADGQNTVAAKAKGAVSRVKNAGKKLSNRVSSSGKRVVKNMIGHAGRVANKVRGMKKTIMRGKNVGKKIGKGLKRAKGVVSKGLPLLTKVAKMGTLFGTVSYTHLTLPTIYSV